MKNDRIARLKGLAGRDVDHTQLTNESGEKSILRLRRIRGIYFRPGGEILKKALLEIVVFIIFIGRIASVSSSIPKEISGKAASVVVY